MQPQPTPTKPVMDVTPPAKPAQPVSSAPAPDAAGIPTTTSADTLPVKEPPHEVQEQQQADHSPDDAASQPSTPEAQVATDKGSSKPRKDSVVGIVVLTVAVVVALSGLAVLVYLQSS